MSKGKLFVLSAPAGTGKTTLASLLLSKHEEAIVQSISCTTRPPRGNEQDGIDYHFLSEEQFNKKVAEGAFLEHAHVFHHQYGTLKQDVEEHLQRGQHVLLVIDTQGAMQIRQKEKATFIFIMPPDVKSLEERLRGRKTESEEAIQNRLAKAKEEMMMAKQYDYVIINANLEAALAELESIITKEIAKENLS